MLGSSTMTGWKRRSSAASDSTYLRYSSNVVAPMHCRSPRASSGLIIALRSSGAPSAAAGADERVQLVDEEHDVAGAAFDFVENAFDAAFELAAVLRARDQRPEREREHALAAQRSRRVAAGDALREAFDDGRLSDAGLADEARIVLAAPRENRNDAIDFAVAPDDRIELAFARELGEVAREGGQRRRSAAKALAELVERRDPALALQLLGEQRAAGDETGRREGGTDKRQARS